MLDYCFDNARGGYNSNFEIIKIVGEPYIDVDIKY